MRKSTDGSHRVVIRASAGTGKTFQLTNRFLALALAGVPLDTILATTFTRKAAGEILDRVLLRLAEAAAEKRVCVELGRHVGMPHLDTAACGRLLSAMIHTLHRLRVNTLDSFFIQIARACSFELDLPSGWQIVDPVDDRRLRNIAVRKLLETHSTGDVVQLLHLLSKGEVARSVSSQIDGLVTELYDVFEETSADAWTALPRPPSLDDAALATALETLTSVDMTGAGKQWSSAHQKSLAAATEGDWPAFLSKGFADAILRKDRTYYRKRIPDEIVAVYDPLIAHGEAVLVGQFANQTLATYRLLERFDAAFRDVKRSARAMRFGDVTRRLIDARLGGRLDEVFYRIDGQVSHLLLDEFQDTSPAQWTVLSPLAHRAAEARADRSFFCVGDVKQAIYGWRGGVAEIFDQIELELGGVTTHTLNQTWRSSSVVVDVVNRVFSNLATNPALREDLQTAAQRWGSRFALHTTARPELAGYWRLQTVNVSDDEVDADHAYWQAVAAEIGELHRRSPQCSLGVLVRRNDAVARLIHLLRVQKIDASEEGGNPLTDSPAVQIVLSALALADHPGSTTARFHVAHSPLAADLGLVDHADDVAARTAAARIRESLHEIGYGRTLYPWVRRLSEFCDDRGVGRLAQLLELAYTYEARATVRTDDFIEFVGGTKVEDVRSAGVRVMTVHQAKGLEFDIVVLPELDVRLLGQPPEIVVDRQQPTSPPRYVLRYVPSDLRNLLPERFRAMFAQYSQRVAEEAFCLLYVAMTRAIHALVMIVRPSAGNEHTLPATFAGVLRGALTDGTPLGAKSMAVEAGDRDWQTPPSHSAQRPAPHEPRPRAAAPIRLAPPPQRAVRGLQRRSPSRMEGGSRVRLESLLQTEPKAALLRGTILHAWFEQIEWIDDGVPDDSRLRALAEPFGTDPAAVDGLAARFRAAASHPAIRNLLSRPSPETQHLSSSPARGDAQRRPTWLVQRERRFAVRDGDVLLQGSIDRLVIRSEADRPVSAEIVDFKTDEVSDDPGVLDMRVAFYRPQMAAYIRAVAAMLKIDPACISARLAFTEPGVVRTL